MKNKKLKKSAIVILSIITLFVVLSLGAFLSFIYLKSPVDRNSNAVIEVKIDKGTSVNDIAKILKQRELIRSELVFKICVKLSSKTLKATVYNFKKSMSTNEIINIMSDGNIYNPDLVRITFHEGKTIKSYAERVGKYTNNTADDFMNKFKDQEYLDSLINKYWFLDDSIKNPNIYVSLEGYLSPNTYEFKNKEVTVEEIIEKMLDQTEKELEEYKSVIESSNYSTHQYLTLASMLELEGTNSENRKMIAGVFYNRLKLGMNLGSDVTTYYAFHEEMNKDLKAAQFNQSNPYNTRAKDMGGKLPIGPICNPSKESIEASINPTTNDYLFFVADKHGKIYYTKTDAEHNKKIKEIKDKGDWIW